MTATLIEMPNTADTINKAVDIIHADLEVMFNAPGVHNGDDKDRMRKGLQRIVARHPDYKRRDAEALADLYFDLRMKRVEGALAEEIAEEDGT